LTAALSDLRLPAAVAQSIRVHFRTEAEFLSAVGQGDLERIAAVPGLSQRRAVELVRHVQGGTADGFLATPAAQRIHDDILDAAAAFAATAAGRNRIRLRALSPDERDAAKRAAQVMQFKAHAATVDRDEVRRLLKRVRLPQEPASKVESGRLVVGDDEAQERLREMGVHKWAAVGGQAELAAAQEYDLVLSVGEDELAGIDHAVEVAGNAPVERLAPEATLAWFSALRPAMESAASLAALSSSWQRPSPRRRRPWTWPAMCARLNPSCDPNCACARPTCN